MNEVHHYFCCDDVFGQLASSAAFVDIEGGEFYK